MQMHSERLNQVLTGWWRKKAVIECPDAAEMWLYWQYTKGIEQGSGLPETVRLPEAGDRKSKLRETA